MEDTNKLIPADGVYFTEVILKDHNIKLFGLLSIGTRPTFNKTEKRIEVYIIDFNETIYGESITVKILQFIRKDKKFDSREDLIVAMHEDKKNAISLIPVN